MRFSVLLIAIVLGTGSKYGGFSLSFDFPAHGHRFGYSTIYFEGRQELWRLCRYPHCPRCQISPKAFVVHVDCMKLLNRHLPTKTLFHIWLLGSWSCPWPGDYHFTPKPYTSLDLLVKSMIREAIYG